MRDDRVNAARRLVRAGALLGSVALVIGMPLVSRAASVKLNWTAPGDDGDVGTATVYEIRYSTSPITQANWAQAAQITGEPAPQEAGSAESHTVNGLAANTVYYFAIKTADEAGNWSALSNVATVTTADEVPPAAIVDLTASP